MAAVEKPHAVCIPYPAQGHINPMLKLAKLLHYRGFHITFVNTEFNHQRLLKSRGPDSLKGLPDFQFPTAFLRPTLLTQLNDTPSSNVPPVSCIVSDGIMAFSLKVAEELSIPEILFWTTSACGFLGYAHYPHLIERGLTPLKDESYLTNGYLDTVINWVPGMREIRLRDFPSFIRTTVPSDLMLNFFKDVVERSSKASAIIFNTFEALERDVLNALSSMFPPIYAIGPLSLLQDQISDNELKKIESNLWKEETGPDLVIGDEAMLPPEYVMVTKEREQQMNCHYVCKEWGIGMEINNIVKREEVEMLVKELMEGEKGKEMKNKAMEWKKMAEEATRPVGSSQLNLDKVINELVEKAFPSGQDDANLRTLLFCASCNNAVEA
ncbi:hypothetical protein HHK36_031801 [Tetracentron sinense]|uniref:Glycosyltransferase N-terminal domain-containing protein n=1 Tax=Tetracentron sinense TaxID=13715 RepID=A0A835D056_TETSI|nr:hypothetical protein HHK36_031801 [Tetracentron sinense]